MNNALTIGIGNISNINEVSVPARHDEHGHMEARFFRDDAPAFIALLRRVALLVDSMARCGARLVHPSSVWLACSLHLLRGSADIAGCP